MLVGYLELDGISLIPRLEILGGIHTHQLKCVLGVGESKKHGRIIQGERVNPEGS